MRSIRSNIEDLAIFVTKWIDVIALTGLFAIYYYGDNDHYYHLLMAYGQAVTELRPWK
jgi:hypothetical protein